MKKINVRLPEFPSSSDDDLIEIFHQLPTRCLRPRSDMYNTFSDAEFFIRYRFHKSTVQYNLTLIVGEIEKTTLRCIPLSPLDQLLLALRFYATGSFQVIIGDFLMYVNQQFIEP